MVDEALVRKLSRQVRVLNIFIVFLSLIFIAMLTTTSMIAYAALHEVRNVEVTLKDVTSSTNQNIDLKNELCSSEGTLKTLISAQSDICN